MFSYNNITEPPIMTSDDLATRADKNESSMRRLMKTTCATADEAWEALKNANYDYEEALTMLKNKGELKQI